MADIKEIEKELMFAYQYYYNIRTGFPDELFRAYETGALHLIDYWQGKLTEIGI